MAKPTTNTRAPVDPGQAPFSQEAEQAVIGSVLVDPGVYVNVSAFLRPEDFFLVRHSYIWEAFERLYERNELIDVLVVADELDNMHVLNEIGGRAYLVQLLNETPNSAHAEIYGRLVERAAVRRRLMQVADEIKRLATDEERNVETIIGEAEARLFEVSDSQIQRSFTSIKQALSAYYDQMEYMMQNRQSALGVPSGFRDLDQLLGGFQKSDLLVFAGRPGMGKCVAAGTRVRTALGPLPIEVLHPGGDGVTDDQGGTYYPLEIDVETPLGMARTSHFYDSGEQPTLTITTRQGRRLTGTHVHPLLVQGADGAAWKPLEAVTVGDRVAVYDPVLIHQPGGTVSRTAPTAAYPAAAELAAHCAWDEITAVEATGVQRCYDLVVPDGHLFVAEGLVNHNTSFLLTTAMNAARIGACVAIFTMEMGVEQMVQRLLAMETGISVQKLRLADLTAQEASRFTEVIGRISELRIFIDDTPALTPVEVRNKCRRLKHEHGLDLVMIDYMQLMNAGRGFENNRVQEISYISRNLKEMARELNVPVISAAQLSRAVEQRQDKRPVLSDLRESGSIEQDSDIVMFLYRDEVYNEATEFPNQADVIISKHRNGPTGTISLYFEKKLTRFLDASVHRVDLSDLE